MKLVHILLYLLINSLALLLIYINISWGNLTLQWGYLLAVLLNLVSIFSIHNLTVNEIEYICEKIQENNENEIDSSRYSNKSKHLISKFVEKKNKINETFDKSEQNENELKKSLDSILNCTLDGIVFVDNESKEITIANESFFQLCGYRAYEISGKDKTSMISPENVLSKNIIRFIKYSFDTFEDSKNTISKGTIEINNVKPNKILKATALPLKNEDDEIRGIVINFKDITKEVQSEDEKKRFISSITHEFRTPLFSIMGYSELVTESIDEMAKDEIKHYLETIYDESLRLSGIIDNLFNAVLVDKEDFNVKIEKINIFQFLNQIVEEKSQKTKLSNIRIDIKDSCSIKEIINSVESISIIFNNLISNMIKFSYKNTESNINIIKDNDYIIIKFTNTGDGIPDEYNEKIFEKFFRVESDVHSISGAGLGLFIARKIARLHGGDITFESKAKEETTFYLKLPIKSKFDSSNFTSDTINI